MKREFPKFGYNPVTGEWNDSLTGEFLWSNVNLSEAVPDVMTPSTWSLWWIFHYESNPIVFPGNHPFCGNICGRPYFNLSLLFSVYRAVGRDARNELQGDLINSIPPEVEIPFLPFSAFLVYRTVLPGTFKARRQMRQSRRYMARFLKTMPSWCKTTRAEIISWEDTHSLLLGWQEKLRPFILQSCQMLRTVTAELAGPATRLRLDLSNMVGETDVNTILSNFSGPAGDLESMGPLLGLSQVAQGKMSRETYLERYGHRGPHEMELSASGAEEDPSWLDKQLEQLAGMPMDITLAKQRAEQAAAWARFETHFPDAASATRKRLEQVTVAARNREAVRSEVTRMARLLRAFLLQVGDVTGLGEDLFFLSLDELVGLLAGNDTSKSRIPARRETYRRYCSLPPYPAILVGRFDPFIWTTDPDRRSDYYDARQRTAPAVSSSIKGFAGAAGCVEGIVRRIDRVEDGSQIQPGEILVTSVTNVGWTPLFPRLSAIVTDVGAPLSHAAIVAREMGIPAVVGCGNATMLLRTGDRIRVDGGRGKVEILEHASVLVP